MVDYITLLVSVLCVIIIKQQTQLESHFGLAATATTTTLYKQAGQLKSGVDFENVTSKSKPNLRGDYTLLFDAHCVLGHPQFQGT